MADYKFTQQSGTNWKVNTSDKCDATEDTNELRAITDDLGRLLNHSKKDGTFPADGTTGGTLGNVKLSNFASTGNPSSSDDSLSGYAVGSRIINISTDVEYVCLDSSSGAAVWDRTNVDAFTDMTDTPSSYSSGASKILTVSTGETAVEFTSSTGIALDSFGLPSTGTTLNSSTGRHGLLPVRTGSTITYFRADGTWATPTGTTGGVAMTFLNLTDTPSDFTDDASKILRVNSSSGAVEFVSTTGIASDTFGALTDITTNNATTGKHGFLLKGDADTTHYLAGDLSWVSTTGVLLDDLGVPENNTDLNATTGYHGLLPILTGSTSDYLNADGVWSTPPDTGEVNTASNAGTTGVGIYFTKSTYDLQFKAIHSTGNISVTDSTGTNTINIDVTSTGIKLDDLGTPDNNTDLNATTGYHGLLLALDNNTSNYLRGDGAWQPIPGSTGGEANTASNTNTTGVGVYEGKVGVDLQFKGIRAASSNVTVTDSTGTHSISLDVAGVVTSSGAFTAYAIPQISSTGGTIKASVFTATTGDVFNFGAHSAGFTEQAIATSTGTVAINWNSGNKALYTRSTGTAGGAATFTFTAPVKSMNLMLIVRGSTLGCTGTVTLPTAYWGAATYPTFSTGVSAIDGVAFYYSTGLTKYLGIGSANFSTV